jgi:hypothetical protein
MGPLLIDKSLLIKLANDYQYHRQTFHLAITFMDFYLSKVSGITTNDFQTLGGTMLYLASKVEEPEPVSIMEVLSYETMDDDGKYIVKSVPKALDIEQKFLEQTGGVVMPTAHDWLLIYFQNLALLSPEQFGTMAQDSDYDENEFDDEHDFEHNLDSDCSENVLNEVDFLRCRFRFSQFKRAVDFLDRLITDYESLKFQYSLLAAGVVAMVFHPASE